MNLPAVVPLALLVSTVLMGCDSASSAPEDQMLSESGEHALRVRHVLAALHIAEDVAGQQGVQLNDMARVDVELGIHSAFEKDPAGTVQDLDAVWSDLDESRQVELLSSRREPDGGQPVTDAGGRPSAGAREVEAADRESGDVSAQQQWMDSLRGKVLVHTDSTSAGYDGVHVANQLVERVTLHRDGRFEMLSGSQAAGAGHQQMAIDDSIIGTWEIQAISTHEARLWVTSAGQRVNMPLSIRAGQLYLIDKPVAIYAQ